MNRVLITGGNGDMAQSIKRFLSLFGFKVLTPSRKEMDVTDSISIENVVSEFKPNILVYTAGYITPNKITDTTLETWLEHFDVNVHGLFLTTKEAIKNGCGTVINIGSTSSFEGRAEWGAYCASKAASMSLIETLAKEGIKSYNVHPARTDTKMRKKLFPNEDTSTLMHPNRVAVFVHECLENKFANGSNIIVKKDCYYVTPARECLK